MKAKTYIIAALLICTSSFAMAGTGENSFKKKVETHMMYPSLAEDHLVEAKVYVEFTVKGKGKIEINKIESENPEMNDYVIRKLTEISKDATSDVIGKTYKFCFSFEVQK